jgi:predicted nucleic-acid-binding Zn-ribbon protein
MSKVTDTCAKCGNKSIVKGEIGLRTSRDLELIMVVRKDHGIEKKAPLQPHVCGRCGYVDFFVEDPSNLKITSNDKPIDPDYKNRPLLEYDF